MTNRSYFNSYFIVMIDYPAQRAREAIVNPEITRREVISRIQSQEYENIIFIHHVHDGVCEDLTGELLAEAGLVLEAAE